MTRLLAATLLAAACSAPVQAAAPGAPSYAPATVRPPVPSPTVRASLPPETCVASYYSEQHRGLPTASGQPFNPDLLTAASWDFPFGTRLKVTHQDRSVVVTVNDRGPAHYLGRCIDLSRAGFERLADLGHGLIDVHVERVAEGWS